MTGRSACLAAALAALAAPPAAACSTDGTGARCLRVEAPVRAPAVAPGDRLPPGRYSVVLNTEYYGLAPAGPGWRYYDVDGRVLRVENGTLAVIEDVTHTANGAW